MRRWERNGCAVHTELPFRFSVIYNLNEKTMKAINNMSDIENDTGTAYMEQAYIQGICDGIRLVKFFQQN